MLAYWSQMGCLLSTTDKHDKSIDDEASSNSVDSLYNSEKVKQDASEALHAFELGNFALSIEMYIL